MNLKTRSKLGMTSDMVRAILGEPQLVVRNSWDYKIQTNKSPEEYLVILFDNNDQVSTLDRGKPHMFPY